MKPIKVVIADDHRIVSEGIKQLLELDGDIQVIGHSENGMECLDLVAKTNPDVLLLDINMPVLNGIDVIKRLRKNKSRNHIRILILTIHKEIEYLQKVMDLGANGYVLKDSESAVLKEAIYAVNNGKEYIQKELIPLLKHKEGTSAEAINNNLLTKREIEVLKFLTKGLCNKEIGYQLTISEKTVKNHISNIFKKINVSDRTQAAVYAIKNNIVEI